MWWLGRKKVDALIQDLCGLRVRAIDSAKEALVSIGRPAVGPLIELVQDLGTGAPRGWTGATRGWYCGARSAAIEVLAKIGDKRAVKPLVEVLSDKDADGRSAAAKALGQLKDPSAVEVLCASLDDEVCRSAAEALGLLADGRAVKPLTSVLSHRSYENRRAAAIALGLIGGSQSVEPLIAALEDESVDVRSAAAEALGRIGDARAVEPLAARLMDSYRVSCPAAAALGKIGDPRAVDPLVSLLRSGKREALSEAARSLGEIGDSRAVEVLIPLLKDQDSQVREAASQSLGKLGPPKDPRARAWLAVARKDWRAVGRLGDAAAEPLLSCVTDADAAVREGAAEALGELTDSSVVERLLALASSQNGRHRGAAAKALSVMYRRGRLDAQSKQRILAIKDRMAQPHNDYTPSSDCTTHKDTGIGVTL